MNDTEQAALDKLVAKAYRWADSRNAKAAATGRDKVKAQSRHRQSEHELAEAVEHYRKLPGR